MRAEMNLNRETKNVLLLCLSNVNLGENAKKKEYSYQTDEGNITVSGFQTNEPFTKALIEKFLRKAQPERLDEVVLICSEKVLSPICEGGDRSKLEGNEYLREKTFASGKKIEEMTHLDYYKESIAEFIAEDERRLAVYPEGIPNCKVISISNNPSESEVSNAAIQAAEDILANAEGKNVKLFIDYNGGQRYVAFMLIGIANLMEIRKAEIGDIITMDYGTNPVDIQSMTGIFHSMDLVAGINEYVKYGRTHMLHKYFDIFSDHEIADVLGVMDRFADDLQLCRSAGIMDGREELKNVLEAYQERNCAEKEKAGKEEVYKALFSYVVKDIYEQYQPLFEGQEPKIIQWCVEKEFVQQALTIFTERMPQYFVKEHIFEPTEDERNIFKKERNKAQNDRRKNNTDDDETIAKRAKTIKIEFEEWYNWMNNFAPNEMKKDDKEKIIKFFKENFNQSQWKAKSEKKTDTDTFIKGEWYSAYHLASLCNERNKRATSILNQKDLINILMYYYLLKDQRNLSNHASEESRGWRRVAPLSRKEICNHLKDATNIIQSLQKSVER